MKNFVQSKNTINFHLNCELCKAWCALAVIQSPAQSFMLVFHSLNSPDIRGISLWVLPKSYWTTTSLPYGSSWSPHRSQSTQILTCLPALAEHKKYDRDHITLFPPFLETFHVAVLHMGKNYHQKREIFARFARNCTRTTDTVELSVRGRLRYHPLWFPQIGYHMVSLLNTN